MDPVQPTTDSISGAFLGCLAGLEPGLAGRRWARLSLACYFSSSSAVAPAAALFVWLVVGPLFFAPRRPLQAAGLSDPHSWREGTSTMCHDMRCAKGVASTKWRRVTVRA
jgi:hypothetical protein